MPRFLPFAALLCLAVPAHAQAPACDPDNGGLKLPTGFCAVLVGERLGNVRHFAVAPNGDVIAATVGQQGGLHLLRDTTGDGRVDQIIQLYPGAGSGVVLTAEAIYFAPNDRIVRVPWRPGAVAPTGPVDTIASGLPVGGHGAKGLALGGDGALYVSFGSRTNSCQEKDRQERSPGNRPCTELEARAGIWRFDPRRTGQGPADGIRFGTGLRNPMAMAIEPRSGVLYTAVHGRDQLTENWGFAAEEGRENPAEEFGPVVAGADYGWPYCYFDPRRKLKVQAPEYGGDGRQAGDCGRYAQPAVAFPAHWAPNAVLFYAGAQFPEQWRGGAFIAFHGSWNRGPGPEFQEGYRVAYAPFRDGKAVGTFETFAAPAAAHNAVRPAGLAMGPDGSLYIGADAQQKIWRVFYRP
jgi:glucose/arabinose dehydrogenase